MEDRPLPALFEQARKIHLSSLDSGVDQVSSQPRDRVSWFLFFYRVFGIDFVLLSLGAKDTVKKGIQVLQKCEDMIGKLGLFSANETKDDISTTNLKYILVSGGSQLLLLVVREFRF